MTREAHSGVYYGWWIVAASGFVALFISGILYFGFTAFIEPIAHETGWSYAQISLAASLRGLEVGLLAPLAGRLVDRWGPSRLVFAGGLLISAGLLLLSRATSLVTFYGAFLIVALGSSGCTGTVLIAGVVAWFRKRAGLATGIVVSGFGLGGLMVPLIVWLIANYGWRPTLGFLALAALVILPVSAILRRKPEQHDEAHGQGSGISDWLSTSGNGTSPKGLRQPGRNSPSVLASSTFWLIALTFTLCLMIQNAIITHIMPYMHSVGVYGAMRTVAATSLPLISIFGRIGFGWLSDRVGSRRSAVVAASMLALGTMCLALVSGTHTWPLVCFVILVGVGFGGTVPLRASLTREYFGREGFGSVFGLLMGITMIGGITGPIVAGLVFDHTGDYRIAWFGGVGLVVTALFLLRSLRSHSVPWGRL